MENNISKAKVEKLSCHITELSAAIHVIAEYAGNTNQNEYAERYSKIVSSLYALERLADAIDSESEQLFFDIDN